MPYFVKCDEFNTTLFKKVCVDGFDSNTVIIVPDTHNALVIKDGVTLETLSSGKFYIFNKRKPEYISQLAGADNIEVIFISKTIKLNIAWGTAVQFDMRDPNTGVSIKLGVSGEYEVQISNPRKAYLELIGVDKNFDASKLKERLLGRLLSEVQYQIANVMNEKKLSYDRFGEVLLPISKEIYPHLETLFEEEYGLRMYSFTILRVILSEEDINKIIKARENAQNMKEKTDQEDKKWNQDLTLRQLEKDDYEKYLEVCKIIGWQSGSSSIRRGTLVSSSSTTDLKSSEVKDPKGCPNCGNKIPRGAKFCPKCGASLVQEKIPCPGCKKMISPSEVYCHYCGTKVKEDKE